MAKWMIEHGAKTIVLLSRSGGGKDSFDQLLSETQQPNTQIIVQKCDVTSNAEVRRFFNDSKGKLPPICGVIHSAMVLRVSLLLFVSFSSFLSFPFFSILRLCSTSLRKTS
jgi:NAD(P)-dependent dehydrogenase (short-subunit alcohol dehydrogenase family)